jgi:uncharacterized coiled-coil DUF342 family protein
MFDVTTPATEFCRWAFFWTEIREQRSGSRDQRAEIRDQGAEIRDQRSEIREQRAESRDQGSGIREQGLEKRSIADIFFRNRLAKWIF